MLYLLCLLTISIVFGDKETVYLSDETLTEEIGIDWWNILSAAATCCPGNTDETGCNNEAGSDCVWFPDPNNEIAVAAGSQCVGISYVKCKKKDINACCTPACNPSGPKAPAPPADQGPNKTPPVCGPVTPAPVTPSPTTPAPTTPRPTTPRPTTPRPTTPSPTTPRPTTPRPTTPAPTTPRPTTPRPTTPAPTTPQPTSACALGVNYDFEGQSCRISGDPHTTLYNGNKHDFQGTPKVVVNGITRNQFYYIHPCAGESNDNMPLKVAGTHYHWGTRSVSGIDYLTVTLTEGAMKYRIYLSSSIAEWADASLVAVPSDYDKAKAENAGLIGLVSGQTLTLGTRFKVYYNSYNSNYKSWFKITIDGDQEFKVYMQGQSGQVGTPQRYRMHYVSMTVPTALKCYTCGLCGDFNIESTGLKTESMEGCDGSLVDYRAGWNPTYTPEAFDTYGWTWEVGFVENQCGVVTYDNTDNAINSDPKDPCDANIATQVETECKNAIQAESTCCNQIGNAFCDGLLADCLVDACAGANGDVTAIADEVQNIIIDPIKAVCADDELQDPADAIPPQQLTCPSGSIVIATNGYNDISGCGLTSCDERYTVDSIEDCELKCQNNKNCNGFSWAPVGGDQVYPNNNVCSLYSGSTPTRKHEPNQIFCKIVPRTCTLTAYTMADDNQYISRSDDNGNTFMDKNVKEGWGQLITTTFPTVTTNTVIKARVVNTGGPGGFIAKFVLTNDDPSITKSKTIITDNPLSTMRVTDANNNNLDPAALSYTHLGGGAWSQLNPTSRPQVTGASWTLMPTTTFNFYLSLTSSDLNEVGCIVRSNDHNNNNNNNLMIRDESSMINDETNGETYYLESFGIISLLLILCFGGIYWRKNKNNKDGYEPLKGVDSEEINPFLEENRC